MRNFLSMGRILNGIVHWSTSPMLGQGSVKKCHVSVGGLGECLSSSTLRLRSVRQVEGDIEFYLTHARKRKLLS